MEWPWAILGKSHGSLIVIWISSCRLLTRSFRIYCLPSTRWKSTCVFLKNCTIDRIWIHSWSRSYEKCSFLCVFKDCTRICYVRPRLRDSPQNWESANTKKKTGRNLGRAKGAEAIAPVPVFLFSAPPLFVGFFFSRLSHYLWAWNRLAFKAYALEDVSPSLRARELDSYIKVTGILIISLK